LTHGEESLGKGEDVLVPGACAKEDGEELVAAEGAGSLIAKALAGALLSGEVVDLALVPSGRRLLGHREVSSLWCIDYADLD
jgi:hypothetical protein